MKQASTPTPVIVVTDIGNDIDDTLALLLLVGSMETLKITAVVTSVNDGVDRGRVTRGFLRLLGVPDEKVEVLPTIDGCQSASCYVPDDFPEAEEANMGKVSDTPRRIVEICKEHEDTGIILYGISALTPLASAIKLDQEGEGVMKRAVTQVYLQGNVEIRKKARKGFFSRKPTYELAPHPDAYNFQNDMDAACLVFDHFQDTVPFTLLGKYAAYQVPVRKGDFSVWAKELKAKYEQVTKLDIVKGHIPNPPDLLSLTKRQMKHFRDGNPAKFDSIYKVPGGLSKEELKEFAWFEDLPSSYICSRPYDPLLGLVIVEDMARGFLAGGKRSSKLFHPSSYRNGNGQVHRLLGNTADKHSIRNSELVHDVLVEHISKSMSPK